MKGNRRLLLGLFLIVAMLTGLLAVSSLVPGIGCQEYTSGYLQTRTLIRLQAPDEVKAGESFSVNGTLYRFGKLGNQPRLAEPLLHVYLTAIDDVVGLFLTHLCSFLIGNLSSTVPAKSFPFLDP